MRRRDTEALLKADGIIGGAKSEGGEMARQGTSVRASGAQRQERLVSRSETKPASLHPFQELVGSAAATISVWLPGCAVGPRLDQYERQRRDVIGGKVRRCLAPGGSAEVPGEPTHYGFD